MLHTVCNTARSTWAPRSVISPRVVFTSSVTLASHANSYEFPPLFSDIQTLEDLVAKLEFENELNRVCSRSLQSKNPESSFNQEESANSDMEEGSTDRWAHDSKEEYSFLLDTILEIERDNDFTADCDVSSLELDLQFSP